MVRRRGSKCSSSYGLLESDSVTVVDVRLDELDRDDSGLEESELLRNLSVERRDGLEGVSDLLEVSVREFASSTVDESCSNRCCLLGDLRRRLDDSGRKRERKRKRKSVDERRSREEGKPNSPIDISQPRL